jgi:hypothetical protein
MSGARRGRIFRIVWKQMSPPGAGVHATAEGTPITTHGQAVARDLPTSPRVKNQDRPKTRRPGSAKVAADRITDRGETCRRRL